MREGHLLYPLWEGDQEGKSGLAIRSGIKVGHRKRGFGGFPSGGEGEGVCHLEQSIR